MLVRDIRGGLTVFDVFADAYKRSIEAFASAVADGTEASPGIGDARVALQIALTARESCATGGARLAIPPLPPLAVRPAATAFAGRR